MRIFCELCELSESFLVVDFSDLIFTRQKANECSEHRFEIFPTRKLSEDSGDVGKCASFC